MRWIRDVRLVYPISTWIRKPEKVGDYDPVLSAKALRAMLNLPKKKQAELAGLIFRLAAIPSQRGDYALPDASGRAIEYIMISQYVIGFWPDHAATELRIVEIDIV